MSESTYWDRTDSFEEKLKILEAAWKRKDFRLARSLAHSLRDTAIQAQSEEKIPGKSIPENLREETVQTLPPSWRNWAQGWTYFQTVVLDDTIGQPRPPEPVELLLSAPAAHATSLAREVRVVQVAVGELREIPCRLF